MSYEKVGVAMNQGQHYGYGIFETIRFQNKKVQNIDFHFQRLSDSAKALEINLPVCKDDFEAWTQKIISESNKKIGVLRVQLQKHNIHGKLTWSVRENPYGKNVYSKGMILKRSPVYKHTSSLLVHHKTVNYLENLLVLKQARVQGFDDVLMHNEKDNITETAVANVFFKIGEKLYTPPISEGLLPGTFRRQVIQACNMLEIDLCEEPCPENLILKAKEVFITNAIMGIMPVRQYESCFYKKDDREFSVKLTDYLMSDWQYQ